MVWVSHSLQQAAMYLYFDGLQMGPRTIPLLSVRIYTGILDEELY